MLVKLDNGSVGYASDTRIGDEISIFVKPGLPKITGEVVDIYDDEAKKWESEKE